MPWTRLPNPFKLERTTFVAKTPEGAARVLQNTDMQSTPGRLKRGRGYCRSDEVSGSASIITACGVFVRRDCRKVLVDASAAGTWRASGPTTIDTAVVGAGCIGPMPSQLDLDEGDGEWRYTEVPANAEKTTVIWPSGVAGRTYRVWAWGTWSQDAGAGYDTGPEGLKVGGLGLIAAPNTFQGEYYGSFMTYDGTNWTKTGAYGEVVCTADGDILGTFADWDGLYFDNKGSMGVWVNERA